MQVIKDNRSHDLSPNATLRTTGGPARRPGSAVNTARATVQARRISSGLLVASDFNLLKVLAKTRNGRKTLRNMAYRLAYRAALKASIGHDRAKAKAVKAGWRVSKELKRRGVYLKQVQAYSNAHRLGTRFDRTEPREKLFSMDRAEFAAYRAGLPLPIKRGYNALPSAITGKPEAKELVPTYDAEAGMLVVVNVAADRSRAGQLV